MSQLRQAELSSNSQRSLMLLGVKANGAVKGRLLVMTLEQRYRNSSESNTEITYTFPLPLGAVLMAIEVELNGKKLKGEVAPKNTARVKYEEALSEGNSSVMLEKNADSSYTLELGNLMAREECSILIRYAQVLATEHGQVRLMLPTTIAPRYGDPIKQGGLQPHQVPVTDLTAEYPFDISLTLYGDLAYANVGSPSHKTSYLRNKDDLIIKLSQRGYLDRDFVVVIDKIKNSSDGLACKDLCDESQYALMAFFSPILESSAQKSLTAKVLVDCSASMSGDSIEAARRALAGIIAGLVKEDKFSLSRFGDSVEHRSRGMWRATAQAKASASRWIGSVQANLGGTEMAQGLVSTISIADDGKSDVLLITDGEIDGIDEVIEVAKKSSHRVFVVAIGSSPAEAHLRRLASATGGYCDFVAPGEDVEPAVLRMSARMRAARASGLRVQWPQDLKLRWAQRVQDYAFEDDALNVCAFADATDNEEHFGTAKLFGRIDGMEGEVLIAEAPLSLTQSTTNILARLTAFERYQELVREPTNRQLTQPVSSAQDLAVTYQLVSDQTNFLLVHERSEEEKAQEMPQAHHVPQMLAAGWGGTGSVARAMSRHAQPRQDVLSQADDCFDLDASEYPVLRTNSDYAAKSTPSVWRKSRTSAAAKVDAMSGSGMDDYEIPAFLRKQADDGPDLGALVRKGIDKLNSMFWKPKVAFGARPSRTDHGTGFVGITPAGMVQWLFTNDKSLWPKTFAELRDIGLDLSISEWLEFEIGEGQDEVDVVIAFLAVIRGYEFSPHTPQLRAGQAAQKKKGTSEKDKLAGQLETLIRAGLKGVTAQTWPSSVVNFPESIQS